MITKEKTFRSGLTLRAAHEVAELSDEAGALIRPGRAPRDWVEFLIRNALYDDVVALLAHVLPRRESVWWAWSCARDATASPTEADTAVLDATGKWIIEQTDELRRAAGDAADALGYETPAAMAGLAAFMCGDTMGPADAPAAPPPEYGAAKAITGSICMAAALGDPEGIGERFRKFIARGMERADKGKIWAPEKAAGE